MSTKAGLADWLWDRRKRQ